MKKILLFGLLLGLCKMTMAQNIGIGNTNPQTTLDIKGGLATRAMTVTPFANAVNIPANEAFVVIDIATDTVTAYMPPYSDGQKIVVYNHSGHTVKFPVFNFTILPNEAKDFICRDPGGWTMITGASASNNDFWSTSGNANLDTTKFLGTTDSSMLLFKINNLPSGQLGSLEGNLSFGVNSLPQLQQSYYLYSQNTAVGNNSMQNRIYGWGNTAMGYSSLPDNNYAGNTSIGAYSLFNSKTGQENTTIGLYSAFNSNGSNNVCLGTRTMVFDTIGLENIVVGASSLYNSKNSNKNISIGARAMFSQINGDGNVAIGHEALYSDTATNGTVAIGRASLFNNKNKVGNVAIGDSALFNNFQGTTFSSGLLSIGAFGFPYYFYAPASFSYSSNNTAIGNKALKNNTIGSGNTAIGNTALSSNINGYNSVAIGDSALYNSTYSGHNVAIGSNALSKTDYLSFHNVAIGSSALKNCKSSYRNIAIGNNSMWDADSSSHNIAIGDNALAKNSGYHNVAIGTNAGNKNLGSYKLYIDSESTSGSPNGSDSSEALIYGDFQYDSLLFNAKTIIRDNAVVKGFTKLGGNATDVPSIKMKKLTGTTANASGAVGIPHGLTQAKILSVSVFVNGTTGNDVPPRSTYANFEYDYYVGFSQIFIKNIAGNDANIINRPIRILVTYEQ